MKFPCPRCNRPVELGYLEKKGDQMVCCLNCKTVVAGTYKKDADRYYWEIYIEKTRPKKPYGGGCGTAIGYLIIVGLLVAAAQCPWKVQHPPPETEVEEQAPGQSPEDDEVGDEDDRKDDGVKDLLDDLEDDLIDDKEEQMEKPSPF